MSIDFLLTSLIVVVSPGTGVLYTLAAGLSRGSRASVVAAFGCTLGIVPHMAAAILGLAALLHASALAFQTFKYLGVAYLLYMAWSALQERGALRVETQVGARSALQVTVTAILINILNPKLSIFFFAFLPQFVSADEPHPLLAHAGAERRLHAADLRGLRRLRAVRRLDPRPRDLAPAGADLDAPHLRRRLRGARRQARVRGSLNPLSNADHDLAVRSIRFHQAVRLLDLVEVENFCWLRAIRSVGDAIDDRLHGMSESGNPGAPNMKLPKKLKCTPLGICNSGIEAAIGARPPRKPARQRRPSRRTMVSDPRTVLLPTSSSTASTPCGMQVAHARGRSGGLQHHLLGAQRLERRGPLRVARRGDDARAGMGGDIHRRLAQRRCGAADDDGLAGREVQDAIEAVQAVA